MCSGFRMGPAVIGRGRTFVRPAGQIKGALLNYIYSENEIETIHSDAFDWEDFENSWYQPEIDISRKRFLKIKL